MIAGMSGTLLSHDAIGELLTVPDPSLVTFTADRPHRQLRTWHAGVRARLGPTASARVIFDTVAEPLMRTLGFDVSLVESSPQLAVAVLTSSGRPVAALIAAPWVVPIRSLWRHAIRNGLAQQVRWAIGVNGHAIGAFDVRRPYARRWVEFDLEVSLDLERSLIVLSSLLCAPALLEKGDASTLERVLIYCERHRAAVRGSLRTGVYNAVLQLVSAFRQAVSRSHTDAQLLDESLIVVYRLLFLLFAEARNLVPTWHPLYLHSYTINAIVHSVPGREPKGVWEAFQALSRLAHRGCRAGVMRVPPFNGRLFSPACAPLAARVALRDNDVRQAILSLTSRAGEGGRRQISYADLGVEQLGAVYEHLLDFAADTRDKTEARLVATGRRKATGSFYTPRPLTEFVVRRGLAPLVQGKTPEQILALRVVDPAMGSGAFLVSACRYLALAYEQALIEEGTLAPADVTEQDRADFRRAVAQRCLFGVDINPMAVQLARLSIWLATLAADKPLTFLDHRLRVGHSLIGASPLDIARQPFPGRAQRPRDLPLFPADEFAASIESAVGVRRQLAEVPDDSLEQVRAKERSLATLESDAGPLNRWRQAADLWCAAWLDGTVWRDRRTFGALLDHTLQGHCALPPHTLRPLLNSAREVAARASVFNWALEFPEVFFRQDLAFDQEGGGFDVVLGNPPWDMLHETGGRDSNRHLTAYTRGSGQYGLQGHGHANLYQLFFERGLRLLKPGGRCALIVPSGLATDHGSARLRRHLLEETTIDTFTILDNRDGIFPIHRSLKFLLLSFTSAGSTTTVPLRGGVRSADSLDAVPDSGFDPASIPLPKSTLASVSGEGLELPDIRSELDLEIITKVAATVPATAGADGWGIHFGRELNATEDRPYFRPDGEIPVVEGKQLRPLGIDTAATRFRITKEAADALLDSEKTFARARLAYRDVASPTNRQTLIAAIVPSGVVTTHTVFCLKEPVDEEAQRFLCGMFNSYVANYLVRLRVGTHVTTAIVSRLPMPRPDRRHPLFREIAETARALAADWDADRFARLNAAAAELYGLSAMQFDHIVSTFPLIDATERAAAVREFRQRQNDARAGRSPGL